MDPIVAPGTDVTWRSRPHRSGRQLHSSNTDTHTHDVADAGDNCDADIDADGNDTGGNGDGHAKRNYD